MIQSPVHVEIDRILARLDGELTSHSQVVNALLDVRTAADDDGLIELVDESLRNIPGKNAAETAWLRNQLRYFDLMAQVPPVLAGEPSGV